jgi:hypothetical protein
VADRRGIVNPEADGATAFDFAIAAVGTHSRGNSSRLPGRVVCV